jgi:hypothetical protein
MSDSKVTKNFKVILGGIPMFRLSWNLLRVINGPHEGDELSRDNPVKIPILHFFIIFILSRVKILKTVPPELTCNFETLQTVIDLDTK